MTQAHPEPEKVDWTILIVLIIGTFMAILNTSIVNVALPRIMSVFNVSADSSQWILTSYMMTLGIIMPITGYLGDTFGYKRMYIIALAIFTLGSALCGLAWNNSSMVAFRIFQAVGGGIMQPVGMAFLYRTTPRNSIGFVLGIYGIAMMAAPAIGPTLGGYLVEYVNWRLIFYINVPIGIINLFLATLLLKETPLIKGEHFDYWGLLTSIIGLSSLLMALSQGNKYGWTSPYIMSLLTIGFIFLSIFVYIELRHPEPLLELRLFKNSLFTISLIIGATLNIGMFAAMFLMPLLLQSVIGLSAMKTGLILLPAAVVTALLMPVSGRIFDKFGARAIGVAGLAIITYTTYMLHLFNDQTPYSTMIFWLVFRAVGMGLCMMPITVIGMTTVPVHLVGRGSALGNVVRQVASSFGIAMFTAIMQHRQAFHYAALAEGVNFNSTQAQTLVSVLRETAATMGWSSASIQLLSIGALAKRLATMSMTAAIGDCYIVASAICLMACFLTFFLPDHRRQEQPAV